MGVFDRIRRVLYREDEPFPLAEVAKLAGVQRRYAEMMIAMRLERGDARSPAALQELRAVWTLPGLVECARDREDAALADAITQLRATARGDWTLAFDRPGSPPLPTLEGVVSRVVGPTTLEPGELSGNPRDGYARTVTLTAHDPTAEVYLTVSVLQALTGEDDPDPHSAINGAHLFVRGRSAGEKLAACHALREALAALGFTAPARASASGPAPWPPR